MNIDVSPNSGLSGAYDSVNNAAANPILIVVLFVIIILYYILFSSLNVTSPAQMGAPQSTGATFLEIIMWGLFIFLIMINGLQYFYGVDVKAGIKNLFTGTPEVDLTITPEEGTDLGVGDGTIAELPYKEVYHIPNNTYTYNESQSLCKAYGGRLATYSEIEKAYEDGGEWCGYGWSKDQMALYPTQSSTWKKLQKIKGHKHDCGRPGVNGGFIANPRVRFGVNCYGHKPKITKEEKKLMETANPYPLTPEEREIDAQVKYYKKMLPEILVSPFNHDNWSQL